MATSTSHYKYLLFNNKMITLINWNYIQFKVRASKIKQNRNVTKSVEMWTFF